ncbi:MAG: ATP-binding protein [Mesorhizobium sp.]
MTDTVFPRSTFVSRQADGKRPSPVPDAPFDTQTAAMQRERATHRLAAIGEMTGGIAHDFRSLLSIIDSGLRLIERSADDPDKIHALIASTREGIDRGVELTSQLLTFAKHQILDAHAGNLNEFLRSFEPFLRYGAGHNVRVRLMLGSDIPACLIDPAFFDAAILNLVINARDAMPDGGEVRIITERWEQDVTKAGLVGQETYVRVRVEDDGCGMPAEVLRKVFDPFFTTKGETGTGIGLSQVYAFATMVGGQVSIESDSGIGTTVTLLFPSVRSDA